MSSAATADIRPEDGGGTIFQVLAYLFWIDAGITERLVTLIAKRAV